VVVVVQGKGKCKQSLYRSVSIQEVGAPKFHDIWHMKVVSPTARPHSQPPQKIFLVLISVRA